MRGLLQSYRDAYSGLPTANWILFTVALINRCGVMVVPFLTLYFTATFGLSARAAGSLLALYGIGAIAGTFVGGWLSDRIGAVRVQVLSLVAMGMGLLILGQLRSTTTVAPTLFLIGAFGEAFRPANSAHLAATTPTLLRSRAFALNRLAINFGMALGPAVGGFLATIDWGLLFWIDGSTCLLATLPLLWFRNRATAPTGADPGDSRPDRSPWRDGPFLVAVALTAGVAMIYMQFVSTAPLYFRDAYGLDKPSIGILLAINPVLVVMFEMVLVHRLSRPNPLPIIGTGALLVGGGFALLPLADGFLWAAVVVAITTFGEMLESPFMTGFVAGRAGPKHRGAYMGVYGLAFGVAVAAAPAVGTWIYDEFGPTSLWITCGVTAAVICLAFQQLARRV